MTYSLDFRKQVLKSLDEGMTFAEAAKFYNLSPTTIQNWKRRVHSKTTRQTKLNRPDYIEPPRNCRRLNFLREYDNPGAVHLIYPQVITA